MKEGYLQLKIAELNDKITKIEELIKFENSKLELLQEKVGEYKEVIKKLKDLDEFKEKLLDTIQRENKQIIDDHAEIVSKKVMKVHREFVENSGLDVNKILREIKGREDYLSQQTVSLLEIKKEIAYVREYTDILVMKLVNKNVLSAQDVNQLELRSAKKAEKQE